MFYSFIAKEPVFTICCIDDLGYNALLALHNPDNNISGFEARGVLALQATKYLKGKDMDLTKIMPMLEAANKAVPSLRQKMLGSSAMVTADTKNKLLGLWNKAVFDAGGSIVGKIPWSSLEAGRCTIAIPVVRGKKTVKVRRAFDVTIKNWPENVPMRNGISNRHWKMVSSAVKSITIELSARSN